MMSFICSFRNKNEPTAIYTHSLDSCACRETWPHQPPLQQKSPFVKTRQKSPIVHKEPYYKDRGNKSPYIQKEPFYIKAKETHHKVKKRNPAKRNQTLNTLQPKP